MRNIRSVPRKLNIMEVKELIDRVRDRSTDSTTPLGEVLRLCMRLGKLLGNEDLLNWARMEVIGYEKAEDLPDYRKMPSESSGDFCGPFGSGVKNAHIPNILIEKGHREVLCNVYMFEPVAELEDLAKNKHGDGNILKLPWSGNMIAYYQHKEIYSNGMVLVSAWRIMTTQKLVGILEIVRTRVLDFVLEIEKELGLDSVSTKTTPKIINSKSDKIQQIFNNKIFGGNFVMGSVKGVTQQTININQGDIESLKRYLEKLELGDKHIKELEVSIKKDEEEKEHPGPAVKSWLKKAGKFGADLASNAFGQLLASAIGKFYGVN